MGTVGFILLLFSLCISIFMVIYISYQWGKTLEQLDETRADNIELRERCQKMLIVIRSQSPVKQNSNKCKLTVIKGGKDGSTPQ